MVSFLSVNFNSTFYANLMLESLPKEWRENNEIVIVDNSHNLPEMEGVRVIQGEGTTHAEGLNQGIRECSSNIIIISDIDCILLDTTLLSQLVDSVKSGVSLIECKGDSFKPLRPCFGVLNKEIFLKERLNFEAYGYLDPNQDWVSFFGDPTESDYFKKGGNKVYADVGVMAGFNLLQRGYKVETIPFSRRPEFPKEFKEIPKGWWFGYEEDSPQLWHIVYGASKRRYEKVNLGLNMWERRKDFARWVLKELSTTNK